MKKQRQAAESTGAISGKDDQGQQQPPNIPCLLVPNSTAMLAALAFQKATYLISWRAAGTASCQRQTAGKNTREKTQTSPQLYNASEQKRERELPKPKGK